MIRIASVVGARPQFVKLAAMAAALDGRAEHLIVHTGQHYDARMSDTFFDDLAIGTPDVHLEVGSGTHGHQTGRMLGAIEDVFAAERPDRVLVYGDTNSTLAATLAAVKIGLPVAHLEAGLRSFNRRMPEEHNRVLTDHASDLLLAPTMTAVENLSREGLGDRCTLVGDVMVDIALRTRSRYAERPPAFPDQPAGFVLATIHRAENTDDPDRLAAILDALAGLDIPVVLPAHPRLIARAHEAGIPLDRGAVAVVKPLAYPDLVGALGRCKAVVTDSGGLQKEAYVLGVPCTTVRSETEWVETLDGGWNVLCPDVAALPQLVARPAPPGPPPPRFGDGTAARQAADVLVGWEDAWRLPGATVGRAAG